MLARNELAEYIADNYGTCDREADCYWGRDARGEFNGCLRTGWRGRDCKHWRPVAATTWEELRDSFALNSALSRGRYADQQQHDDDDRNRDFQMANQPSDCRSDR